MIANTSSVLVEEALPVSSDQRYRPSVGLVWWVAFVTVAITLIARNRYLFTTKVFDEGDYGANSIAILKAEHLQLLTGIYSRLNFYHPGPAFLYIQAAGEVLFHDVLHLVPTPWNGQQLAMLLVNAALVATTVVVLHRWHRSTVITVVCGAVMLGMVALHPAMLDSEWNPYLLFAPTVLLLVSAGSVAMGRASDIPVLALAAALLVNAHVDFLLFAPVLTVLALIGYVVTRRRTGTPLLGGTGRSWLITLVVTALLAFPIVLNLAQHWPGEFTKYLDSPKQHNTPSECFTYITYYWHSIWVAVVLNVLAVVAIFTCPKPELRAFLRALFGLSWVMTAMFAYYVHAGVDQLDQRYLGFFYWAIPLVTVLVIVMGTLARLGDNLHRSAAPIAGIVAAAAALTLVLVPAPDRYHGMPALRAFADGIAAAAHGKPVVLELDFPFIDNNDWPVSAGLMAYYDRRNVEACVIGSNWRVLMRSYSLCTPTQMSTGARFHIHDGPFPAAPNVTQIATPNQTFTATERSAQE